MAMSAGRVGINPDQVDIYGRIKKEAITEIVAPLVAEIAEPIIEASVEPIVENALEEQVPDMISSAISNSVPDMISNAISNTVPNMISTAISSAIATLKNKFPPLDYQWTTIRYTCDGAGHYEIVSPDIQGVTLINTTNFKGLVIPNTYKVLGYFWGFDTLVDSSNHDFNNGGFYVNSSDGSCILYLTAATHKQDQTCWIAVEPRNISAN